MAIKIFDFDFNQQRNSKKLKIHRGLFAPKKIA